MAVSVLDAANYMCMKCDWMLNQIELQKLLYIAHMVHLGEFDKPLVRGNFEAWEFGPVHPKLHDVILHFGSKTITRIGDKRLLIPPGSEEQILDAVSTELGFLSAEKLIDIIHWPQSAWKKNCIGDQKVIIPKEDILEETLINRGSFVLILLDHRH